MDHMRQIPVFVFPTNLKFYLGSRQNYKQMLTIYNPYEFKIRYKVLCTTPNKYTVIDPDGSIAPQSCIDLVIRHTMPVQANCNIIDKFRVSISDHVTKQFLGKRDIESRLLPGEPDVISSDSDNFQSLPQSEGNFDDQKSNQIPIAHFQRTLRHSERTNYFAILIAIICISILMLPTKLEPQEESFIPMYLYPSVTLKLGVAYVLGMLTTIIFRQ
ncbi:MSP (Major sperm protein) domain [Popillia japonica]|uniref:MSP (Major sperm protein) domain n=1 Tax=Popillia japonica TaxID=7064 RepID=A0AAW1JH28_POPJA